MVDGHREECVLETAVLMEIEKLRRVSLASLRAKYREVFVEGTRCRHREHLFRRIAWRLQALAEGDLTERARAVAPHAGQPRRSSAISARPRARAQGVRAHRNQSEPAFLFSFKSTPCGYVRNSEDSVETLKTVVGPWRLERQTSAGAYFWPRDAERHHRQRWCHSESNGC